MKVFLNCLLIAFSGTVIAQKEVRTHYNLPSHPVQEIYKVDASDAIVGKYQRFYENGNPMVVGNFDDGQKNGLFSEYHENGKLSRKITYVNGLRHGAVEVFNEEGKPVQKAYYQNDILVDSV